MVCLHAQFLCSLRHNINNRQLWSPPLETWERFKKKTLKRCKCVIVLKAATASDRLFLHWNLSFAKEIDVSKYGNGMWGDIYLPQRQKCQHWHAVVHLRLVQCPYCNHQGSRMGFWKSQGCSCRTVVHQHRLDLLRQWSKPLSTEKRDPSWCRRRRTQVFT